MKAQIRIRRDSSTQTWESFTGDIISETTSHYKITHETNPTEGEWFAKDSRCVKVEV